MFVGELGIPPHPRPTVGVCPTLAAFSDVGIVCAHTHMSIFQVARARGAHFARPDKKPAPGTARATAAARGSGSSARGRRGSGGGGGSAADGGGSEPKELWPGPFAEARRVRVG